MHFPDEVLDHLLGDFEVRDHTIAHGPDGFHVQRRLAEHLLGLVADRIDDLAAALVHVGNHGGFIELDALALDVDERVRCPEVNGHVRGKHAEKATDHVYAAFLSGAASHLATRMCPIMISPYTPMPFPHS